MSAPAYQLGFSTLEQQVALEKLDVSGRVPAWLEGTLLRIGPAKFEVGGERFKHWFDGLGMLHRFSFAGGRVSYANRFLDTEAYRESAAQKKITRREFATDPCRSIFGRVLSVFTNTFSDNANVNIAGFGGPPLALTETPHPIAFDPATLRSVGPMHFEDELEGQITTAHPHFDRRRNKVFSYLTHFARKSEYNLFSLQPGSRKRELIAALPVEQPAYMHSFAMSERYLVLAEFPYVVHPLRLKLSGKPFIENYRWRTDRGTKFTVVDKETGRVATVAEAEPIFAFHHVNAFEQDGELVLDLVAYPNAEIIEEFYLEKVRHQSSTRSAGKLRRYRFSISQPKTIAAEEACGPQKLIELPRIDEEDTGQSYRCLYAAAARSAGNFLDELVKIDLAEGTVNTWHEENCYPGEPVPVSGRGAEEQVILSVVLDGRSARSFLLILDANTFAELARAEVPHHIPFGFHGKFI